MVDGRSGVEARVNAFRQFSIDAVDPDQFVNTCLSQASATTEMLEQCSATFRTNANDFFQRAGFTGFLATAAMAGDREAMGFIAHGLHQVRRWRFRPGKQRLAGRSNNEIFIA